MRLRELTYPIAVLRPHWLMGGRNAELHSKRRWNYNLEQYYYDGAYDDAVIFDAEGHCFEVEKVFLRKPSLFSRLTSGLIYFGRVSGAVDIDMELRLTRQLTLPEFCQEILETVMAHPEWWTYDCSEEEVRAMFTGHTTFKGAINAIGSFHERHHKDHLKGHSDKIVDLREGPEQV